MCDKKKIKEKLFCELLPSLSSSLETKCPQLLSVESERKKKEKKREGDGKFIILRKRVVGAIKSEKRAAAAVSTTRD